MDGQLDNVVVIKAEGEYQIKGDTAYILSCPLSVLSMVYRIVEKDKMKVLKSMMNLIRFLYVTPSHHHQYKKK